MSQTPLETTTIFVRGDLSILLQVGDRAQEIFLSEQNALGLARALLAVASAVIDPSAAGEARDQPVDEAGPFYKLALAGLLIGEVLESLPAAVPAPSVSYAEAARRGPIPKSAH